MACTLEDLVGKTGEYLPADKLALVHRAYEFAEKAHAGQMRVSGAPFIEHPLEVARVLADLGLDGNTIAAGLLHDVVEDCGVPKEEILRLFGADVGGLVEGVTKLSQIEGKTSAGTLQVKGETSEPTLDAESLRKLLVAMAEDVRVILIKLADRLHNMRTIQALPVRKQVRIAQETLEIYAPLAHRLGISAIQGQLEDLAFRTLYPEKYREISNLISASRVRREAFLERVVTAIRDELKKTDLAGEVSGRAKNIYSIHQKMQRYAGVGRDFDQIYDLIAVRVLVEDIRSCYEALGVIHNLWHPIRGEFDDYIANPRENMYQSLHTSVLGPDVTPFEVQIRTYRMHEIAEYGVAAHWRYKEGGHSDAKFEEQMTWMRQLLQWHKDEPGAEDFLESVKTDIFPDQVFVYTPKGQIRELPAGATSIDFAYSIHTDLGHSCAGAKVNGKMVSLDHQLQNGDTVEIIVKPGKGPSLDWLNQDLGYAKTANARGKIRHWFRRQERTENIERGRTLLEKELRRLHVGESEEAVAKLFSHDTLDDFLVSIGSGALNIHQLAPKLLPTPVEEPTIPITKAPAPGDGVSSSMTVMGMSGLAVHLGQCCSPIVGDHIQGFITRSRGVTVHRRDCKNFHHVTQTERIVDVEWGTPAQYYEAKIAIEAWDRVGLLRDITTLVSAEKINIAAVQSTHHKGGTVFEQLTLHTRDAGQLSRLLSKLEGVRGVIHVERVG